MSSHPYLRRSAKIAGLLSGAIALVASVIAIFAVFTAKLPTHRLHLSCDLYHGSGEDDSAVSEEAERARRAIIDFVDFAREMRGQVVFLDIGIVASTHVGTCDLAGDWDGRPVRIDEASPEGPEFNLTALTLEENAGAMSISFPVPDQIPRDGVFTTWQDWHYYAVSGPFVLQSHSGNGFDGASFLPVAGSDAMWREATCARAALRWPAWIRPFRPCF